MILDCVRLSVESKLQDKWPDLNVDEGSVCDSVSCVQHNKFCT